MAAAAIAAARRRGIPLLVDPKVPHIDYYARRHRDHAEPSRGGGGHVHADPDERRTRWPPPACFRERAGCESVLITRGEHGMTLLGPDGTPSLPAEAREVSDVTGAGDTVIATMTLALAAGSPLVDAARLANRAAGIVVGKFGPATVTTDELR